MHIIRKMPPLAVVIACSLLATFALMAVFYHHRSILLDLEHKMTAANRDAFHFSRDTGNLISNTALLETLHAEWGGTAERLTAAIQPLPEHPALALLDADTQQHIRSIEREWDLFRSRLEELKALLQNLLADASIPPRQKRGIVPTIQYFLAQDPVPYETVAQLNSTQTLLAVVNNVLMPRLLEETERAARGTSETAGRVTDRLFAAMGVFLTLQILLILLLFQSLLGQRAARLALQEANDTLEQKVQDRTEELHASNEELQASTEELQVANEEMVSANEELRTTIEYMNQMREKMIEQEKLASLGGLVAGIAHEVNTPIGSALTAVTFLSPLLAELHAKLAANALRRTDFATFLESADEAVHLAVHNLTRANDLVGSFKKISADQSMDHYMEFDLTVSIHDVLLSLRHECRDRSIHIETECPPPGTLTLWNYPGAFVQILTNLVMNSIHHGLKDTEEGIITITVRQTDDRAILFYSDNGIGMTEEVRAHAFDPFFTTARGVGATGLGMSIIYNLVMQRMGGTLDMQTAPGEGVFFTIGIPLRLHIPESDATNSAPYPLSRGDVIDEGGTDLP